MFIPIGFRRVVLNEQIDETFCCPRCNSTYGARIEISRQHIQFFWIPTFAFPKRLRIYCLECQKKIKLKTLRDSQQIPILNLVSKSRGPLWQFTGSFVLLGLFAFIAFYNAFIRFDPIEYLEEPQVGDRFAYEVSKGKYSYYLVESVTADSLELRQNLNWNINKRVSEVLGLREIYDDRTFMISREEILRLRDENVIFSARRPLSPSLQSTQPKEAKLLGDSSKILVADSVASTSKP